MRERALTARECEVLALMARGLSGKETARHLGLSQHTVKNHRASIFKKLGARNGMEAVFLALQRHLIDDVHQAEGAPPLADPAA